MLQESRVLQTIPYDAGNTVQKDLPRVYVSKKWQLRGKISVTVAGLSSGQTYGTRLTDAPATFIKRVDVRVVSDKSQIIKSISGQELLKMNLFDNGGAQENVNNIPESTTSAPSTVYCYFSLDLNWNLPDANQLAIQSVDKFGKKLATPQAYNPQNLTLLNPTLYNPVEIYVTYGTIADLMTGYSSASTFTINSCDLKLVSVDLPEMAGVFSVNREIRKEQTWTSANTDLRIDLPKGNYIRRVFLHTLDNGTASNSVINNVQVVVDENIRRVDAGFNQLRNETSKKYNVPFAQLPDGSVMIDFDSDKDFTGLLDVRAVDNVRLALDVNSSTLGKVFVVTQEITKG